MKEMKLYKIVVRDNTPELVPVSNSGTLQTPDGKLYWIIPVEPETQAPIKIPQESQPTSETNETNQVITLLKEGVESVMEISRRVKITPYDVTQIIHEAGLQTPGDILREKIKQALLDAGKIGANPRTLRELCPPGQRLGPVIGSLLKRGEAKRLTNGNYAIHPSSQI